MFHRDHPARPRPSRSLGPRLVALVVGALIAACGSDDDAGSDPAVAPAAPITAPAADAGAGDDDADDVDHPADDDVDHGDHDHDDHDDHDHEGHDGHDHEGHEDHDGDHADDQDLVVERVEVDVPHPRLTIVDAASGAVNVLDIVTGDVVADVEVGGPAYLASDDRYVYVIDYDNGEVTIVDAGSWTTSHGDHGHSYVTSPTVVGSLTGPNPAHTIIHDGHVAVFFDGSGSADVVDLRGLGDGAIDVDRTVETALPHHGLVVPFDGHDVVSIPGPTEDDLPIGVEVRHDGVEVEATFEDCPEMHGEAVFAGGLLFACEDGALWVTGGDEGWAATKLAYPDADADDRTWSFVHDERLAVGAMLTDALVVVDTATASTARIDLPGRPVAYDVASGGERLVVLTADGSLHLVGVASGEVETSVAFVDPVDLDDSDAARPVLVMAGEHAYVSDPANDSVIEVQLRDGLATARTFVLGLTPAHLELTGTG